MTTEPDIKEVPITADTAHQYFNKRQMAFIVKMYKENYKLGFKHGMMMKPIAMILLFTSLSFGQSATIAAGNATETMGEVFPIMQQVDTIVSVSLGVPKYEIEKPIIIKKKLTIFEKLMNLFKRIFK